MMPTDAELFAALMTLAPLVLVLVAIPILNRAAKRRNTGE